MNESSIIRIEPSRGWVSLKLRELWEYRDLIYFLIWRDIKVRYKQTLLGAAWAIIQPLSTMVIFSVVFGKIAKMPSNGIPYPIFVYTALVPWTFFSHGLASSSNSLASSSNLIKKVYFPRLALPLSTALSGVVDLVIAFVVLLGMMFYYDMVPTIHVVWLPFFLLLTLITSLGVGLWLGAINVKFRDVRHTVPFIIQFWLYASPVAYPSSLLPEPWRTLAALNPMVGVLEGFRWALLGASSPSGPMTALSSLVSLAIVVGGLFFFRRMERTFADVV